MVTANEHAAVKEISASIARELLKESHPHEASLCKVIIEECCDSGSNPSLKSANHRHGFIGPEGLLMNQLPVAVICGVIVEVVKYLIAERLPRTRRNTPHTHIQILGQKFSEEARKKGLTVLEADELAKRFTKILIENPTILP